MAEEDPHLWLEDVLGEKALAWVEEHNAKALEQLGSSEEFDVLKARLLSVLDSKERIPYVSKLGDYYYNFWQDENHEKGIARRTTLSEYRKENPKWETVLDVDKLAREENENWVYKGSLTVRPSFDRALVQLSRGGADAVVVREFDRESLEFVEDGFVLPEAKSDVAWVDREEILVATDFGEDSLTESGYPRFVKRWKRGTPLSEASLVFQGETTDVGVFPFSDQTKDFERVGVVRAIDFYNSDMHLLTDDKLVRIDKPTHADVSFFRDWLLISPKEDWDVGGQSYKAGSLLASNVSDYLTGKRELSVLFKPTASSSLAGFTSTRNYLLLNILENVRNRIEVVSYADNAWRQDSLRASDGFQTISVRGVDEDASDEFFLESSDFISPPSLGLGSIGSNVEVLKQEPHAFDAQGLQISQHWATSKDGTRVPYFQIGTKDINSPQPTLLYGYGGFEIAMVPSYSKVSGSAWLEQGGVYVIANIRGGGEFGPNWHRAALRENRHRAYDDFIAVAEHLVSRKITEPSMLGIMGGSNGGLLMGNMLTRRPDLFGAIVAAVPLFDMKRYHLLLAGASWVAEYGDPDVAEDWAFLHAYSPYHNLSKDVAYPPLLVTTSTRDDRVHPGHARKLVARMQELGKQVLLYENTEGGHAGAASNAQRAHMYALQYQFLWETLTGLNTNQPD